jgi:hypothetical protein
LASPHAGESRANGNGSPVFRQAVACDKIRWSRDDEGAIFDCEHRNVNPADHPAVHLLLYMLLHIANRIRQAKHQIITGRFRLARAKLQKTNLKQT